MLCHIKELKDEYLEALRILTGAYRELFDGYRKASAIGRRALLEWPSGCYPPGCMRPVGAL